MGGPRTGKSTLSHNFAVLLPAGVYQNEATQPSSTDDDDPAFFKQYDWETFEKAPEVLRRTVLVKDGPDGDPFYVTLQVGFSRLHLFSLAGTVQSLTRKHVNIALYMLIMPLT